MKVYLHSMQSKTIIVNRLIANGTYGGGGDNNLNNYYLLLDSKIMKRDIYHFGKHRL